MRYIIHALTFVLLTLFLPIPVLAQVNILPEPNVMPTPGIGAQWPIVVDQKKTGQSRKTTSSAVELCTNHMDAWPEELAKACRELIVETVRAERLQLQAHTTKNHALFHVEHMQATFRGQRWEGAWVFWIVVAVVGVGLLAAVAQFLRGLRLSDGGGSIELAVSNNELKFKTTWLGALLLGMSMGFLLIYLFFVYPIRYIGS